MAKERAVRNRNNAMLVLVLVVLAHNAVVLIAGGSLIVSNIACVAGFVFFTMSLAPGTLLGFALTNREWGDILRREMRGDYDPHGADFRRAAARSLAVLSTCVLLGLGGAYAQRRESSPATAVSILIGLEAGFIVGYLLSARRRDVLQVKTNA